MNNNNYLPRTNNLFRGMNAFSLLRLLILFSLPFASQVVLAATTEITAFDHITSGFNLTGAHSVAPCESCHIQGIFKGTPRDCISCHSPGNGWGSISKPANHIPTTKQCDVCHQTMVWTNATFSHIGLAPGYCLTCHNGVMASGQSSGHVPTASSCDSCHKTVRWSGAIFSHIGIVSGCTSCHGVGLSFTGVTPKRKQDAPTLHMTTVWDCSSCHFSTSTFTGASGASAMPANHLPTTQTCALCHASGFSPGSGVMNHLGILNGCKNCHNGQVFVGVTPVLKPGNHLPTSLVCETCHSVSQFTNFSGVAMNHIGIVNNCASCHGDGLSFAGITPKHKSDSPTAHLLTTQDCSGCHFSTITFTGAISNALPGNHLPITTQACTLCHASGTGPGSGVMNHLGILNGCSTCHSGQVFIGVIPVSKPGNHIPTGFVCEACHSASQFANFTGAAMNHIGILNNCTNCHNGQVFAGVSPVSKPGNHVPTAAACELCHSASQFTNFTGTKMSHTGILNNCVNCHNGQIFFGVTPVSKPSNHLPTTAACELCHSANQFTNFAGTTMIHTGIFSGCVTCHNGQVFAGVTPVSRPSNHLPTGLACETCHLASQFTTFSNTPMNHTGILSGCVTCHNGQVFAGVTPVSKPTNHIPTIASCEICHTANKFINFAGTTMNHVGINNNCSLCHSDGMSFAGVTPKRKQDAPTTHLTTSDDCSSCHFSTSSFVGASGSNGLPTNHLPTTQTCTLCHASGYGVGSGVMNHLGILSGCSTCHNGQVFYGVTPVSKPGNHLPTSATCETCHSANQFTTFSGTVMIHTGIVSNCVSCHNGQVFAGVTPVSKPGNHLPTSGACETCHSASKFTNFSGTAMVHTGILSGCATCHNGQVFYGVTPVSKPSNHLPTIATCETCHSTSQFTNFAGTLMNHIGIVNNCMSCHGDGLSFSGVTPKHKSDAPTTHLETMLDCSACHFSTTTFTGAAGVTSQPINHVPTIQACTLCHVSGYGTGSGVMNHLGILNGCATCHNGQSFAGVTPVSKPGNHLPTTATCETCHSASRFTNFSGATMSHTGILNGCANCHNGQVFSGVTPVSKPTNHLPTTATCETCHPATRFTNFSGTPMVHTGILSGCATCHNGQVFAGVTPVSKPSNHLPTTAACELCHSSSKFTSFSGTAMIHTGIVNGCATCHNGQVFYGVTPVSKPGNHLPTSRACENCHPVTQFTTFSGAPMNHVGITSNCTTCHNGQVFAGVTPISKSSSHIPYATSFVGGSSMGCEFCHSTTSFTSFSTGLKSSTIMHNGTQGNGNGGFWCKTCHASGTSYIGVQGKRSVTHESASGTDCSQSGCHRPLGNEGSLYNSF